MFKFCLNKDIFIKGVLLQNGVKLSNDDIIIEVLSFFVMMPEDLEDATLLKIRAFRNLEGREKLTILA